MVKLNEFLECFFPEDNEPIFVRGFSPKEMPHELKDMVYGRQVTRQILRENKLLQQNLLELNKRQGLYFVVNSGGFKQEEIVRFNAVFCEIDNLPIEQQHDLYDLCPLPPSIRVVTKKSIHCYWLLAEEIVLADWLRVQCGLIDHFKSDEGIKNGNRVMRLPFFNHLSWDGQFHYNRVSLHTFRPTVRFVLDELTEAFPYSAPVVTKQTFDDRFNDQTIEGIGQELRYRISLLPSYRQESDKIHASAEGVCHSGQSKSAIMVNLRTGAVFCHAGCDYWRIAEAFGLSKPVKGEALKPRWRERKIPTSETGKWLAKQIAGN